MSLIYFLNVWVINLDRKGYWITESEQKNRALPEPLCSLRTAWIQELSSISSRESFCWIITLSVLKVRNMLALILCWYLYSVHLRRGQRPSMLFALCLLLSSSQLTSLSPISFSISRYKINSRFYCDNVLYSRLFSIYPWEISREHFSWQFTHDTWPAKIGHFFSYKT